MQLGLWHWYLITRYFLYRTHRLYPWSAPCTGYMYPVNPSTQSDTFLQVGGESKTSMCPTLDSWTWTLMFQDVVVLQSFRLGTQWKTTRVICHENCPACIIHHIIHSGTFEFNILLLFPQTFTGSSSHHSQHWFGDEDCLDDAEKINQCCSYCLIYRFITSYEKFYVSAGKRWWLWLVSTNQDLEQLSVSHPDTPDEFWLLIK